MKFKVSDDVEAPMDQVWAGFTDFTVVEADIRAREAVLTRVGDWRQASAGAAWRGSVPVRGKVRPIEASITVFQPGRRLAIDSRVGGMACQYEAEFAVLEPEVTRVSVTLELRASTLSARLLLQSLKIARRRVIQRLEGAVVRQGQSIEDTWRARA